MFGIGIIETVVILIAALVVVGPSRLPGLATTIAGILKQFRRTVDDIKDHSVSSRFARDTAPPDPTPDDENKESRS